MKIVAAMLAAFTAISASAVSFGQTVTVTGGDIRGAMPEEGGAADPVYGTPADPWAADTSFRCPAVAQLMWHAAADNPSYLLEFARVPSGRETLGATHASELAYVFAAFGAAPIFGGRQVGEIDDRVSDAMQQYWTNFAKTGDPDGPGPPVWPKFDPVSRAYIQFTDAGPLAIEGLRRPYCEFFIENARRFMAR